MRETDLRTFVPRLAADWLATEPDTRRRTFEGTMAFVDISGFTALTERLTRLGVVGSEELNDILDSTFTAVLQHARHEDADLIKWGGDAVLLLYRGDAHAARAARAAVAMRGELREVGRTRSSAGQVRLRMSVGLHSGPFHLFLVGDPDVHRELIVSGPTASRTAQMEALAQAGQILVSSETAALLDPSVLGEAIGEGRLLRRAPGSSPTPAVASIPAPAAGPVRKARRREVATLLPPPVRAHLLAAAGESEHRSVAVAFVQFSGTDALLERQGEDAVADALDAVVRNAQDACLRNGTTFLESDINDDGGKLMLVAGAPGGGRDVEDRILRTVRLIVDRAGVLPLRAGINRGAVFGSDFGPDFRRTYSITGDAINLAARVMGKAAPGQVLATVDVVNRAHGRVSGPRVEPFMVKGKARPVQAVSVESVGEDPGESSTSQAGRPEAGVPVVGREEELAVAKDLLHRSLTGLGAVLEIVADAGMGKSALAWRIAEEAPGHQLIHCPSGRFGGALAFNAIRRMLRNVLSVDGGAPKPVQLEALRAAVTAQCPELLPWFPLLAAVLDAPVADTDETRDLDERFRAAKVIEVVVDFLRAVVTGPTIFLFEDADEMDQSSVAIALEMAEQLDQRPWVMVTTRTQGDGGFAPSPGDHVTRVELGPLGTVESLALLESWSMDDPVSPHLLRAIAAKAGGNPLFLEALLSAARQHGTVADLPDSVEGVVTGQIDRLDPRERTMLRFAAVLGEQFSLSALRDLVRSEGWTIHVSDLRRLDQFIELAGTGTDWWRFTNAVIRDTAYAGLPFRLRRRMHQHVGAVLESSAGASTEKTEALATHFLEAGDHRRAWTYSRIAGDRARGLYSYAAAIDLYTRAVSSAAKVDDVDRKEVATVLEALGDVADLAGLSRRAIAAYRQARDWARGEPILLASLMSKEAALHQRVGELTTALRIVAYARRLAAGPSPEASSVRSRLSARRSFVHYLRSRHAEALRWSAIALEEAQGGVDATALAYAYNLRELTLSAAGQVSEEKYGELALASYELSGDLMMQAKCLNNLGIRAFQEGEWPLAAERYAEAARRSQRVGDTANEANCIYNLAELRVRQRRFDEAEPLLAEAHQLARVADDVEGLALIALEAGKMRVGQGRAAAARLSFDAAREGFTKAGLDHELMDVGAGLAECSALEGDLGGAVLEIGEVLLEARRVGDTSALGSLHYVRGTLLLRQSRWADAEQAFTDGLAAPDPGDGGCTRALNHLGLARARACARRAQAVDDGGAAAAETLRRMGVVVPTL